jgi:hypothetical protein
MKTFVDAAIVLEKTKSLENIKKKRQSTSKDKDLSAITLVVCEIKLPDVEKRSSKDDIAAAKTLVHLGSKKVLTKKITKKPHMISALSDDEDEPCASGTKDFPDSIFPALIFRLHKVVL